MGFPITRKVDILNAAFSGDRHIATINAIYSSVTFTVDTGTNQATTATNHNLVNSTRVHVSSTIQLPTATTATNFVTGKDIYAKVIDATTLEFYTDQALSAQITFVAGGVGVHTLTEQPLVDNDLLPVFINHEVPSHSDHGNRFTWTIAANSAVATDPPHIPDYTITFTIGAGHATFTGQHFLILYNGSNDSIGDTSGSIDFFLSQDTAFSIVANSSYSRVVDLPLEG